MWGDEVELSSDNGFYRIELSPALCTQPIGDYCMIGGTADISAPTPTPQATATAKATATAAATAATVGNPTATPSPGATPTRSPSPAPTWTPTTVAMPESDAYPRPITEPDPEPAGSEKESNPGLAYLVFWLFAGGLVGCIFLGWLIISRQSK